MATDDYGFIRELVANSCRGKGYFAIVHVIACFLPKHLHEQLHQLVNGPIWDGDVVSKNDRSQLIDLGLATRVTAYGEQGYTAATYLAYSVNKEIEDINKGRIHK